MNENHNIFIIEDRWKQPVQRVTQSDTKCALRVGGEMELADELVKKYSQPPTDDRVELLDGSKLHVRPLNTGNFFGNLIYENCVLAGLDTPVSECA